ncbi:uncharacterized protein BYT42DRAFT_545833 [Radiomyces spectabilis]|uniref:uncharacterized protein n=1 Tax=Radiomyces spectabilis TaxID=64574 RepID=UPI00221F9419|nr:uncharacterized protein BYT42DRAFT_545833 [Radiomyces spectabilis]KAI8379487.1 hypothetical protein BYT42DRAFT_545833 [Radiomyces spectabilis]
MASGEGSNKPYMETDDSSSGRRPPPKKRFLSSRSSSPTHTPASETDNDQDESMEPFKESLDIYRKDAITRQEDEYKRLERRVKRRIDKLERTHRSSEQSLHVWSGQFRRLHDDILALDPELDSLAVNGRAEEYANLLEEEWTTEFTTSISAALKSEQLPEATLSQLIQRIELWLKKRRKTAKGLDSYLNNGSMGNLRQEYDESITSWVKVQRSLYDIKNRYRLSNLKFLMMNEELGLATLQLSALEEALREAKLELVNAENRLQVNKETTTKSEEDEMQLEEGSNADEQGAAETSHANATKEAVEDPLIRVQQVLDQQLREIDAIKEQRIELKQQQAQLEIDVANIPESRIYRSSLCRQLSQSCDYFKDKSDHMMTLCRKLQKELDEMHSKRRQLFDDLDVEQGNHIKGLEDQLRKLESDLTRIRGQRDALQVGTEVLKACNQGSRASVAELGTIIDVRNERVDLLRAELSRLQRKNMARTGHRDFYEAKTILKDAEFTFEPMQRELSTLTEHMEALKSTLITQHQMDDESQAALEETLRWAVQAQRLEADLSQFESKYGFTASDTVDENAVIYAMQEKIQTLQTNIADHVERLESQESSENEVLEEIDKLAKVYPELEGKNMTKIEELKQVEDEIMQLQRERVKYNQTFTALNKSKDAHAMVANAFTKQIEKQLAHIKQMNEREKNLTAQITVLDRELNTNNVALELYRQKSMEAKTALSFLQEKMTSSKEKIQELEKSIMEKIRSIEEGAHARLRLEENIE